MNTVQVRFKRDEDCSLTISADRMLSIEERVFVVLQMAELRVKSVISVQRAWRRKFHTSPPTDKTITSTFDRFVSTGSQNGGAHIEQYD